MFLSSTRTIEDLKPVLSDPGSVTDPTKGSYWVFSDISIDDGKWFNLTIISPLHLGQEFNKTYGHYHGNDDIEIYKLISGKGVFQLQKPADPQTPEKLQNVVLIQARPGDEITIPPGWGHSWSNVGQTPLLSFDNWTSGHQDSDYANMTNLHGMAYYLIDNGGQVRIVANQNYQDLPKAEWLTAEEFKQKYA